MFSVYDLVTYLLKRGTNNNKKLHPPKSLSVLKGLHWLYKLSYVWIFTFSYHMFAKLYVYNIIAFLKKGFVYF